MGGSQLATMVFLMILFATATTLYMGRGAIIVSFIVCYSLTSLVAGYSSGALYCRCQGGTWIKTMMLTAGLFPGLCLALTLVLPFGSIFIEMYFVFTSFWNYKFYYVYGFMFLVYVILAIVTVCVTIVVTYFLLNNEDYRWPWTAFAASCSTAGYVFLYSVYYF